MTKQLFWLLALFFSFTKDCDAIPSVVPDKIPCFVTLETNFFVETYVSQGLSLYNVRQELWFPINQTLQAKSLEVPERMKRRTAYMVPNPIEYPMDKAETARILKEVLFEVFLETMAQYYQNERPRADFIFDYIFTQQLPNFVRCFGPEARKLQPVFYD
jgi:hypothetical protein